LKPSNRTIYYFPGKSRCGIKRGFASSPCSPTLFPFHPSSHSRPTTSACFLSSSVSRFASGRSIPKRMMSTAHYKRNWKGAARNLRPSAVEMPPAQGHPLVRAKPHCPRPYHLALRPGSHRRPPPPTVLHLVDPRLRQLDGPAPDRLRDPHQGQQV
jgi:hypothetical protein